MLAASATVLLLSSFSFAPSRVGQLHTVRSSSSSSSSSSNAIVMQDSPRGFGKPSAKAVAQKAKASKPKSSGAVQRDKAAEAFDKLKAGGAPEYMVLIRTVDSEGVASKWYPVGGLAVPRSSSEDQALSLAIFNNEDDLLKGAFRNHPFLRNSKDKFEYGYRIKDFEDDPVKVATKESMEKANNPVQQWFNALDNPLNDGSGWFNPLKRQ